jgi:RHS repeat-associated protein
VLSPAGELAATTEQTGNTTLQLTNLHGDAVISLPLDPAQVPAVREFDEFGIPRAGDQPATRYGWLGARQRSSETPSGNLLMGVRLYDPTAGRFLSNDPVPGGSATAYDYANQDPINQVDLDGRFAEYNKDWCNSGYCVGLRRICDARRWCSVNWYFRITKPNLQGAWFEGGFTWSLSSYGTQLIKNRYGHGEFAGYTFHGSWYNEGGSSHGRGRYGCGWRSRGNCHLGPWDNLVFEAHGRFYLWGRGYGYTVGLSWR